MIPERFTPWLIGIGLTILLAGAIGFVVGAGSANGIRDAHSAREDGFESAYKLAFDQMEPGAAKRGAKAGISRGKQVGRKAGSQEGKVIGAGNAVIEQAVSSQKSAEASASAAESEIAARRANCGVVPAAPGWCPTSSELSAYNAAVQAAEEAAQEKRKREREEQREAADERR